MPNKPSYTNPKMPSLIRLANTNIITIPLMYANLVNFEVYKKMQEDVVGFISLDFRCSKLSIFIELLNLPFNSKKGLTKE